MRDLAKLLIILFTHLDPVLPSVILPDHQCPDPFTYQEVDDLSTCRMHVLLNASVPPVGQAFHVPLCSRRMPSDLLEFCTPLVIVLVDALHWAPVNDCWFHPRFVC